MPYVLIHNDSLYYTQKKGCKEVSEFYVPVSHNYIIYTISWFCKTRDSFNIIPHDDI